MHTYNANITKGGGSKIVLEIKASSQGAARAQAEAMVKSSYPGYKVQGNPQPQKK